MTHPTSSHPVARGPFAALDAEWAVLCRRHRRSRVSAGWGQREPALSAAARLEEVIPPPGVDRSAICGALARLAAGGDDLAARALLQLLVPGLVRLAARWRWQLGGMAAAGWEVLGHASVYIARLRHVDIGCSPAGYVLRSVERDLVDNAIRAAQIRGELARDEPDGDWSVLDGHHRAASAEDTALAGPLLWGALADSGRQGERAAASARVVLLHAAGHSLPELARRAGTSKASVYRLRDRGHAQLRDQLAEAS